MKGVGAYKDCISNMEVSQQHTANASTDARLMTPVCERPANQIQSRYQSPRFGPYLIHNTICRWKGDEPSESRTSCAEIRQRKPPAGRSPIAIGNMYRRLRFVQVCGNGEYVRMVLGDDAVEALAMMPYYSKLQLTVLQFQQAAETVTSLLFLNLSSPPLPRPRTPSKTSRL
ncbi:hypothetical protein IG631_24349 [Alternaria alternata]|nr:hypothetical protein IG631_24349 [Alternaria alternata]